MTSSNSLKRCCSVLIAIIFSNCTKESPLDSSKSKFTQFYESVKTNCVQCHAPDQMAQLNYSIPLDFSTQDKAYSDLTSNKSKNSVDSSCDGIAYVTAKNLNKSYIMAVFVDSYNINDFAGVVNCKPPSYHLNSSLGLKSSEKTLLQDWILEGAQK